jgi:hypothetical protein
VDDLALQVRLVDDVGVDDAEPADAGGREVERRGRAEAAGADQQDLGVEQLQLSLLADLGNEEVAAVAGPPGRVEPRLQLDREAVPLPVGKAAGEGDDVLVAHLFERLRGERGAVAGGAVEQHPARGVGRGALDPRLQVAARDVDGARDVALVPLVLLAHVDDHRLGSLDQLAGALGVDLRNLGAHLLQQFPVRRHRFPKYSDGDSDTVVDG